ncbi:HNH endonuclease [Mycobacterium intracellulare]|uniref:HNH endonuclease n=1 Tax=Mycobacterium intracellulare TaxID=1767 RepID=UPI0014476100
MTVRRPCLECGRLSDGSRCQRCHRDRRRRTYDHPAYRSLPAPSGECQLKLTTRCLGYANSWDHIVPLSRGGTHDRRNLRPACVPCNSARRDRDTT